MQTPLSKTEQIESRINHAATAGISFGDTGSLIVKDVSQIMEVAKLMAVSRTGVRKHLRDNPGACMAVAMQAFEWGMNPFAVANKSYEVNDQIAWESQLINAVILRRAPIRGRFRCTYTGAGAERKCHLEVTTRDGEVIAYESPAISAITVKNSPLWKSDPDQQLYYYSSRAMCRRYFPDVLLGVYAEDEVTEERQATGREIPETAPAAGMAAMLGGPASVAAADDGLTIMAMMRDRITECDFSMDEVIEAVRALGISSAPSVSQMTPATCETVLKRWNEIDQAITASREGV